MNTNPERLVHLDDLAHELGTTYADLLAIGNDHPDDYISNGAGTITYITPSMAAAIREQYALSRASGCANCGATRDEITGHGPDAICCEVADMEVTA
jgi:hypothetical protein